MPRFCQTIHLDAPPQAVYDFVTNTSLWPSWHPATRAVRGAPARPLQMGETVVEEISAAGRRFDATWQVTEYLPPQRWSIATRTPRGHATVSYDVQAETGGTRFQRTCEFASLGPMALLDGTLVKWMLARQAARALENLRQKTASPAFRGAPGF